MAVQIRSDELEAVLLYISGKIATYKRKSGEPRHAEHRHDFTTSAETLATLKGELANGFHLIDAPVEEAPPA